MAIALISSELKITSGNLTIPVNCNFVIALVLGTTNPTINSVAMIQNCSGGVSISSIANPPTGTIPCAIGQSTRFVYLSGAGSVRDAHAGNGAPYSVTIDTSATDVVFGVADPLITSITGGGSAMAYLDNYSRGYKFATGATMDCVANTDDPGGDYAAFISISAGEAPSGADGSMICVY